MKKVVNSLLNSIGDNDLEKFSFTMLFLWTISPIIEYIFRNYCRILYTSYFIFTTYIIGLIGILTYIIYFIKLKKKEKIKIKEFIPEILIIILLIISIISSILSENTYLSFFGESYRKEGLIVYIMYIGILLMASIIKDSKYIKYIFKSMIASCLIITIIPLFKSNFTYVNFTNVFHNLNHYGYYLMINTMLAIFMFVNSDKWPKKSIYMIIYIFFLYLLIRNDTFGSYLAIFVTLIFLLIYSLIKKRQRLNIILIVLAFISTSFFVSHYDIKIGERVNFESTKGSIARNIRILLRDINGIKDGNEDIAVRAGTGRGILWKEAINYILEHPLIGGGMECLKEPYKKIVIEHNDRPHNMILQVSSFIGIPGAIIYIGLILYIAINNLKRMKDNPIQTMIFAVAMCYFISSMFGNSMYYTSPYFMILLGLLIGFIRFKNKKLD